nr:hypothetical protein [uncultured Methanoregula sp.]
MTPRTVSCWRRESGKCFLRKVPLSERKPYDTMRRNTWITGNAGEASGLAPAESGMDHPAQGTAIEHQIFITERPGCVPCAIPRQDNGNGPSLIFNEGEGTKSPKRCSRSNPLVYEAITLLKEHGYLPARVAESSLPIHLIGLKKARSLLIHVIRSRTPVPSAARLHSLFLSEVEILCRLAGAIPYQIMIWVYSPACNWRYYLVYPGGLRRDLDFPASLDI